MHFAKWPEWEPLAAGKEKQHFVAIRGSREQHSEWEERSEKQAVQFSPLPHTPFTGTYNPISLRLNFSVRTNDSFSSLASHPGLGHLSCLLTPIETHCGVSSLRHPVTACYPCQGHGGFTNTGSFLLPVGVLPWACHACVHRQPMAAGTPAAQRRDVGTLGIHSPWLLLLRAGGLQQPQHRASAAQHLENPAVIYNNKDPQP